MQPILFSPLTLRKLELKNRIVVSPMCQYSAHEGIPNSWHLVHLGSRAVGGAGLVFTEATGVSPEGRITPSCTGIWNKEQVKAFSEITKFVKANGAVAGMQLAHAGRKASKSEPWNGDKPLTENEGGWIPLAPSAIAFDSHSVTPREMSIDDMKRVEDQFLQGAKNAQSAGFDVIEIHMAHGYLMHEFLSPLSNLRKDEFGGSLENRMKFPLRLAKTLREFWPQDLPVFVRISASDWTEGGWDLKQSILFSAQLKKIGIDVVDCSSGGNVATAKIPAGPNYQVPFSEGIKSNSHIATGAVGIITEAHQAEEILKSGQADLIFMAREFLRDPYWPLHAAHILGAEVNWPKQYERAKRH